MSGKREMKKRAPPLVTGFELGLEQLDLIIFSLKRAVFSQQRAVFSLKRAVFSLKRAVF
jgi:hypothetical protein